MKTTLVIASLFAVSLSAQALTVVNFDDLAAASNSYYNGSDDAGGFTSGGVRFYNYYSSEYGAYWEGFSYSTLASVTPGKSETSDYMPYQYNVSANNNVDGNTYALMYQGYYGPSIMTLNGDTSTPLSIDISNDAYAWGSMTHGDYGKQFGEGDWFKLTITGLDALGSSLGSVDAYLADFTNGNSYILNDWTTLNLSALGTGVSSLKFTLTSSDTGSWGINTPAYVAIDNFTAVPEPSTYAALTGLAVLGLALYRKRRLATSLSE